jgi:hypothetical protein
VPWTSFSIVIFALPPVDESTTGMSAAYFGYLTGYDIVELLVPQVVLPFTRHHAVDMASLGNLPVDIVLDNLLSCLRIKDVVSLFSVNRAFAEFGKLEAFWIRRLKDDFRFPNPSNGTRFDSIFLYSRLYNPKIFVWGWAPLLPDAEY